MRYIPYEELTEPNIIVDGAGQEQTVLTLSHWPKSGTPCELKADLSAEIVFRYLKKPEFHQNVRTVSNNHFDEDGLVGVFTLIDPDFALQNRELLIDIAAAGDFGTYRFREAARIAMAISAFVAPESSPLDQKLFKLPYSQMAAGFYRELLSKIPELLTKIESFKPMWEQEDALLTASEQRIRSEGIGIEEIPDLDLAIVTLPESSSGRRVPRFLEERKAACHPFALHNATNCFRILLTQGRTYELKYRYESWVQYVSRRPAPRVNLGPLADQLSAEETAGARWEFDGVDQITPSLHVVDGRESSIPPERFRDRVQTYLRLAKPEWDPFD